MPTLITTIEDFSPVILYSGNGGNDWTAGTSSNDSEIDKYVDFNPWKAKTNLTGY